MLTSFNRTFTTALNGADSMVPLPGPKPKGAKIEAALDTCATVESCFSECLAPRQCLALSPRTASTMPGRANETEKSPAEAKRSTCA